MFSRQQSQRTTRRGAEPGAGPMPSPSGFQPVSSQSGQDIIGSGSVQVTAEPFRVSEFALGAHFELPHALPRQVKIVADFLKRPRLLVFQPETQAHDVLL